MRQEDLDALLLRNPQLRVSKAFGMIRVDQPGEPGKKRNKFNAQKTGWNDSKAENTRAWELRLMERAWEIKNLKEQVNFVLQEKFVDSSGNKIKAITYTPDFTYETKDGKSIVEEKKWCETQAYILRKKLFLFKYPQYIFRQT